jgi:hypothetical protein
VADLLRGVPEFRALFSRLLGAHPLATGGNHNVGDRLAALERSLAALVGGLRGATTGEGARNRSVTGAPWRFGGRDDYAEFEADGSLVLKGNATGWFDLKFPHGVPKVTGPGNPTLTTYLGAQRGYAYAVNDAHDFDPQEYDHTFRVGGALRWHVHVLSRANDGTPRGIKFELERSYLAPDGVETQITPNASAELTIPAGTTVNRGYWFSLAEDTVPGIGPVWMLSARLKRIAAAGTAPSVDPIVKALHAHVEIDMPAGSRTVSQK